MSSCSFSLLEHARQRHRPSILLPVSGRSSWYPIGSTVTCTNASCLPERPRMGCPELVRLKSRLSNSETAFVERSTATVVGALCAIRPSRRRRADDPSSGAFYEPIGCILTRGHSPLHAQTHVDQRYTVQVHSFGFPGALARFEGPYDSCRGHGCVCLADAFRPLHPRHRSTGCKTRIKAGRYLYSSSCLLPRRRFCIVALANKYISEHSVRRGIRTYVSLSFESKQTLDAYLEAAHTSSAGL